MNDIEGDPTGPSGSSLRGRRRNPTACLHCRKRKIRCNAGDGETCDKCRAQNKQCVVLSVTCEEAIRLFNSEPENMSLGDLRNLIQRLVLQGRLSHTDVPTNFLSTCTRQMSNIPTASQPTAAMRTGQNMRDGSPSWFITTPTVASAHLMPDYSSVPFISHVPRHHQQITQRHSGDNFNPAPIQANSGTGEIHATAASAPAVPSGTHSHQYLFPNVPTATFGTSIHHGNYTAYTEHRMHAIPFLGQDQVEHANDPSYDYVSQLPPHLRYPFIDVVHCT